MDFKKILGLSLIGYFLYNHLSKTKKKIEDIENDIEEIIQEQQEEAIPPIQRYLQIIPKITFSEITGNEWTGIVTWEIKNTSSNYTFNITRIKSNLIICGYTSIFVPGNKDSIVRIAPGQTIKINSTWQDKRWYAASNVEAKDTIREILRADKDKWLPELTADVVVWARGTGQVEEQKYVFPNLQGEVLLTSGAKEYWSNQGEYAGTWED